MFVEIKKLLKMKSSETHLGNNLLLSYNRHRETVEAVI